MSKNNLILLKGNEELDFWETKKSCGSNNNLIIYNEFIKPVEYIHIQSNIISKKCRTNKQKR